MDGYDDRVREIEERRRGGGSESEEARMGEDVKENEECLGQKAQTQSPEGDPLSS